MTEFDPAFVAAMRARGVEIPEFIKEPDKPIRPTPEIEELPAHTIESEAIANGAAYGEPADREAEELEREQNESLDDFPLIRDAGEVLNGPINGEENYSLRIVEKNYGAPIEQPRQQEARADPLPKDKSLVAFPLVKFKDIHLDLTRRNYSIKGLLPDEGIAVIWGPPKCYKSFWIMDAAFHIALGWMYRGRRVKQGAIVYIGLEGQKGLPGRKEAFARHHGVEDAPFYLITTALNLAKDADELAASIRAQLPPGVQPIAVIVDTLNRSLVGSESSDEDMAAYLAGAGWLQQAFNCLIAIVHHCGIEGTRPRGHTSLTGTVDVQLRVERVGNFLVTVTVELAKDIPEGTEIQSRLDLVELGLDPDGDMQTSLIVLPTDAVIPKAERKKTRKLNKGQRAITEAIHEVLGSMGKPIAPRAGMAEVLAVKIGDVEPEFNRRYTLTETDPAKATDSKRKAFSRAFDQLPEQFASGHVDGADRIWKIT